MAHCWICSSTNIPRSPDATVIYPVVLCAEHQEAFDRCVREFQANHPDGRRRNRCGCVTTEALMAELGIEA